MAQNWERNHEILAKRMSGRTFRSLAEEYGLTHARIRQICISQMHRESEANLHKKAVENKIKYTFYDALLEVCNKSMTTRIFNCLRRVRILDRITEDPTYLDSLTDEYLLRIRNIGNDSITFIKAANELYKTRVGEK